MDVFVRELFKEVYNKFLKCYSVKTLEFISEVIFGGVGGWERVRERKREREEGRWAYVG